MLKIVFLSRFDPLTAINAVAQFGPITAVFAMLVHGNQRQWMKRQLAMPKEFMKESTTKTVIQSCLPLSGLV